MPSPFPGMDPYLEHPQFFPGLHARLINRLSDALQEQLPQAYYVDIHERVWIDCDNRRPEPDIILPYSQRPPTDGEWRGTVAVGIRQLTAAEQRRETFLDIRTVQDNRPLVSAIEILSLSNKTPGDYGHTLYITKQAELRRSQVNIVEIDLLRGGQHRTLASREDMGAKIGSFDYHVCIRKMADPKTCHVYPIWLDQRLPAIAVPLLPVEGSVAIDLQTVFDRCYDAGPYLRAEPYRQPPEPPLTPEQVTWADKLLRDKGFLPPA